MTIHWYTALDWAAKIDACFSTIDLAEALPGAGIPFLTKKKYANTITQKLWKWGYLKKAAGPTLQPEIQACHDRARKNRLVHKRNERGRGGPGYNQGRPPSIWIITPKGQWRAGLAKVDRKPGPK